MKKKTIATIFALTICGVAIALPSSTLVKDKLLSVTAADINNNIETVTTPIDNLKISGPKASYQYKSDNVTPTIIIKDNEKLLKQNLDYQLTYKNNNKVGQASVIITGIGNYTGNVTKTFSITPRVVNSYKIDGLKKEYSYNPNGVKPNFAIYKGNVKLKKGKDYNLIYANNNKLGTGKVTIKFTGNYTGSSTKTFKILKKSIKKAKITGLKTTYKYTGKKISPDITVTVNNNKLKKGVDYTLSYSKNVNKGAATITIKGKGNYTSSKKVTFKIAYIGWINKNNKRYYYNSSGKKATGLTVIKGKNFYFNEDGSLHTGWKKMDDGYYYFKRTSGRLLTGTTGTTIDGIKIDKNGKAVESPVIKAKIETMITARKTMQEVTNYDDDKETKRLKCFKWVFQFPYHRFRNLSNMYNNEGWESTFANDIFKFKSGCCVSEACAVAFLFNEIGYGDVYVAHDTSHAWVKVGDRLFDPLFAEARNFNSNYNAIPTDYRRNPAHTRYIG